MTHLHSENNALGAILPNIAFVGKAGAGKSSAADILCDHYFYTKHSLAGPLKDMAAQLWGEEARSDRAKLQGLGVAVRRIHADTWVNLLLRGLSNELGPVDTLAQRACVDDVRFPNEFDVLRQAGFIVVKITARERTRETRLKGNGKWQSADQLSHESETALDDPAFRADYVIDNDLDGDGLLNGLLDVLNKERR